MTRITVKKEFLSKQLSLNAGDRVIVTIDKQANVVLLDDVNLGRFRRGAQFQHCGGGGFFKVSPVTLTAPLSGSWHVVIDLPNGGVIGHSISVLPR